MEGLRYGGSATTAISYLSEVVSPEDKNKYLAEMGMFGFVGFLLGALFRILSNMGDKQIFGLHFDSYIWPGTIQTLLLSSQIVMTLCYFKEMPFAER